MLIFRWKVRGPVPWREDEDRDTEPRLPRQGTEPLLRGAKGHNTPLTLQISQYSPLRRRTLIEPS